jgi:uncharacterized membrane protein YvbJ
MSTDKDILKHIKPVEPKIPSDDFFSSLAAKATKKEQKQNEDKSTINRIILYYSSAIAAILIIGMIVFQQFNMPEKDINTKTLSLANVSTSEIIEYVEQHLENYATEEIIDLAIIVLEEEIDLISDENFLPENIQFTDIESYISEEEIELFEDYDLYEFDENELLIF